MTRPAVRPRHPVQPSWSVVPLTVIGALVVALLATACRAGTDGTTGPTTAPATTGRAATPAPTGPDQPAGPGGPATTLYYLRDGKVAATRRSVDLAGDPAGAVRLLIAGPTPLEGSAGLTTAVSPRTTLLSLRVDGATAVVDLSRPFETADTRPQVAQIVFTLTAYPSITSVKFLVDGTDNGATGVAPLDRASQAALTPVVLLEGPTPGTPLEPPLKLTGTVDARNPTVGYQVQGADGAELARGSFTATLGSAARRKFDVLVPLPTAPPGPASVTITPSGAPPFTVPVTVG